MTIKISKPFTIWLIGPSASGKLQLLRSCTKKFKVNFKTYNNRWDNIRDLFDNKYGYDAISRRVTKDI